MASPLTPSHTHGRPRTFRAHTAPHTAPFQTSNNVIFAESRVFRAHALEQVRRLSEGADGQAGQDAASLHPLPQAQPDAAGGRLGHRVHVPPARLLRHARGERGVHKRAVGQLWCSFGAVCDGDARAGGEGHTHTHTHTHTHARTHTRPVGP
eukprot:7381196-Prymnesium_polylepis.1